MAAEGPPLKKAKKEEVPENEDVREYDQETQKALEEIDSCQNELDALNDKAGEEILKVEQKYNKLRSPLYEKRAEVIKRIPDFWVSTIMNHPQFVNLVDPDEEQCISHLYKLEVEEFDDIKSGYRIKFFFTENPFFSDRVLTKEFKLGSSVSISDHKSESTKVKWKEGNNLPKLMAKSKRRTNVLSFFKWFEDNEDPTQDEIAETIKDDIWPNPLQYFLVPEVEMDNGTEEDLVELEDEELDGDGDEDEAEDLADEEEDAGAE